MTTIKYTFPTLDNVPEWLYPTTFDSNGYKIASFHDGDKKFFSGATPVLNSISPDANSLFGTALTNESELVSIMSVWSSVINVTFIKENVATLGEKQIHFGRYSHGVIPHSANTFTAHASSIYAGQYALIFNYGQKTVDVQDLSIGTWGAYIAMHELGHMLGIGNNSSGDHGSSTDDLRFTIMKYPTSYSDSNIKIPLTPGMQDIKTLQAGDAIKGIPAYGASTANSTGNTTHTFTQEGTGENATGSVSLYGDTAVSSAPVNHVMTIWDSDGDDTIDASGVDSKVYITLKDGEFSSIGSDNNKAENKDTQHNVGILTGSKIENAKGGSDNDLLEGNELANTLEGNKGADTLNGGNGDDRLEGGEGTDALRGDGGADTLIGDDDGDVAMSDILEGGAGFDTYWTGDKDVILNDVDGEVYLDKYKLTGGEREEGETVYTDADGSTTYQETSGGLIVTKGASTLTIKGFKNGDLGIKLGEGDPDPEPPPYNPEQPLGDPLVLDINGNG